MTVTIDFESRSPVNIKDHGAYVYNRSRGTQPICIAYKEENDFPKVWIAPWVYTEIKIDPKNITRGTVVDDATTAHAEILRHDDIVAHNSMFEYLQWNYRMSNDYSWPGLPMKKLHDTVAQLGMHGLPISLDKAGQETALNLQIPKDKEGHAIMMKICKPRKLTQGERGMWELYGFKEQKDYSMVNSEIGEIKWFYHEDPRDYEAVINYCCTDVEAEYLIYNALAKLPPFERELWLLDQKINLRGMAVDVDRVEIIVGYVEVYKEQLAREFQKVTNNAVSSPRAYKALREWLCQEVPHLTEEDVKSVDKDAVEELLKDDRLPLNVKHALEIKAQISKASVAKFKAMLNQNDEGRVRGMFQYHAASTGRWAGRSVQLHNLVRSSLKTVDYRTAVEIFRKADLEMLRLFYGEPFDVASMCVRAALIAAEGMELVAADYSGVEGRALAFLAGEQWVLDAITEGKDMYIVQAAIALNKKYEEITKLERQNVGKPAELGCGYGGGAQAVRNVGGGGDMTDKQIKSVIVTPWRKARPKITDYWEGIEAAAWHAIKNPGAVGSYKGIHYVVNNSFLLCRLPSNRVLRYFQPHIKPAMMPWKKVKPAIHYWAMRQTESGASTQWTVVNTRGSKLVENIVQAYCRDLLAEGMLRLAKAGYKIVLHVHDEAVSEMPIGTSNLEEYCAIMSEVPTWAKGMPLAADGWIGKHYRKD